MFETSAHPAIRNGLEQAKAERGAAIAHAWQWLFGAKSSRCCARAILRDKEKGRCIAASALFRDFSNTQRVHRVCTGCAPKWCIRRRIVRRWPKWSIR